MNIGAQKIVTWLVKQNVILEEDREIYEYSFETLCITMFSIVMALMIGTVIDGFLYSVVFAIPFLILRSYCGGYHARSLAKCMCYSCILLILVFYVMKNIQDFIGIGPVMLVAMVSLCRFSPIQSANRNISEEERQANKNSVKKILCIYAMLIVVLLVVHADEFAVRLAMGIVLTAILQVPCIMKCI